jgi:hypothetical protein
MKEPAAFAGDQWVAGNIEEPAMGLGEYPDEGAGGVRGRSMGGRQYRRTCDGTGRIRSPRWDPATEERNGTMGLGVFLYRRTVFINYQFIN